MESIFTSEDNANYILSRCISLIHQKTGISMDRSNHEFFDSFNTVASTVFKYESPKLLGVEYTQVISKINEIVINELYNYTIKKFKIQPTKKLSLPPTSEKFRVMLDSYDTVYTTPIQNVSQVKAISLSMYNEEYIINPTNNTLILRESPDPNKELYTEQHVVTVEPGNYNLDQLQEALQI